MRAQDYAYFDTPFAALAHRGGSLYPPNVGRENTVSAFRSAVELGYRYLETDVHATSDGVLIAFHDDVLDRVTDATGTIHDRTAAEVAQIRIDGGEHLPTLAELFETFPDARFNIDIKAPDAIAPLAEAIDRHHAQDRVCVGSFGIDRIRAFRRLMGRRVPTTVSSIATVFNAYLPLLPRLVNSPGVAIQLPITHAVRGVELRTLTARLVRHAHARGKVVHVWTIDDPGSMHDLIDRGVDGIVSDRIDVLRDVLIARGLWEGNQ